LAAGDTNLVAAKIKIPLLPSSVPSVSVDVVCFVFLTCSAHFLALLFRNQESRLIFRLLFHFVSLFYFPFIFFPAALFTGEL
jgi:hypothetical protein